MADKSGITLERMRSFVRVADRGSLSAVAREYGVGQSTITRHVARGLFDLQDRYPGIAIDLGLSDVRIDLVREAVDVAVRLGPLGNSSMQLKRVGVSRRILVASREYLARNGHPKGPDDLRRHEAIRMGNVAGSDQLALQGAGGAVRRMSFAGRLTVDHGLAAREALIAGRGIAAAHLWLVDDLLASGAVERVLPDLEVEPVPLSILFVPARARIARVRLVIDALAALLDQIPGIHSGT